MHIPRGRSRHNKRFVFACVRSADKHLKIDLGSIAMHINRDSSIELDKLLLAINTYKL
jgi:hypothetical protein